jgi:hypothetical protein
MGVTGTEVAKDAAGMVLTDDNFATIVQAVKNGRNVYANIKRSIQFLLSGNAAAIITVLYASLLALPVPFAAVHLLFINLLTDSLPAIALGLEPHTDAVMREKPRPREEGILTRDFLTSVVVEGAVIAAAVITAFHLGLSAGGAALGSTMAFATLCLSRLFHGFDCKSARAGAADPAVLGQPLFAGRLRHRRGVAGGGAADPAPGAAVPGGGPVRRTGGHHRGTVLRQHAGDPAAQSHHPRKRCIKPQISAGRREVSPPAGTAFSGASLFGGFCV